MAEVLFNETVRSRPVDAGALKNGSFRAVENDEPVLRLMVDVLGAVRPISSRLRVRASDCAWSETGADSERPVKNAQQSIYRFM